MSVKADVYFSSVTRETGVGIQGSNASKATVAGKQTWQETRSEVPLTLPPRP